MIVVTEKFWPILVLLYKAKIVDVWENTLIYWLLDLNIYSKDHLYFLSATLCMDI